MNKENLSSTGSFFIVGFSDFPKLQVPLFAAFLFMYLTTILGNLLILAIIYSNSHLHTPMYFFLTHLAFDDISYTSIVFPQLLAHFFLEVTEVSYTECLLQMYFFMVFIAVELLLLTSMAYDRYVAICYPLRYRTIMNKALCMLLAAGSWAVGFLIIMPYIAIISNFSFCESHTINHFFCDITALLKISCSSTGIVETLIYTVGTALAMVTFFLIIFSYSKIASSILKIKSRSGKDKAFSTCASHLTVVILFYITILSAYVRPISSYSMKENKLMSLLYAAVTPMCNPIIYTLKNTEFKNALRKAKNTF